MNVTDTTDLIVIDEVDDITHDVYNDVLVKQGKPFVLAFSKNTNSTFNNNKAIGAVTKSLVYPVERKYTSDSKYFNIPINLNVEDREAYDKYSELISTGSAMFNNDMSLIYLCCNGNDTYNADYFREKVARDAGWDRDLDLSIEYNKQLNDAWNPTVVGEAATVFFNYTRERGNIIKNNTDKLNAVRLVLKELDNRVLIMNDSIKFANTIVSEDDKVYGYNGGVESRTLMDEVGDVIVYKSGAKKGEPKLFGATSLNKSALEYWNVERVQALSCGKTLIPKSNINAVNTLIFTGGGIFTPLNEVAKKADSFSMNNNSNIICIYFADTIDEKKIIDRQDFRGIEPIMLSLNELTTLRKASKVK